MVVILSNYGKRIAYKDPFLLDKVIVKNHVTEMPYMGNGHHVTDYRITSKIT